MTARRRTAAWGLAALLTAAPAHATLVSPAALAPEWSWRSATAGAPAAFEWRWSFAAAAPRPLAGVVAGAALAPALRWQAAAGGVAPRGRGAATLRCDTGRRDRWTLDASLAHEPRPLATPGDSLVLAGRSDEAAGTLTDSRIAAARFDWTHERSARSRALVRLGARDARTGTGAATRELSAEGATEYRWSRIETVETRLAWSGGPRAAAPAALRATAAWTRAGANASRVSLRAGLAGTPGAPRPLAGVSWDRAAARPGAWGARLGAATGPLATREQGVAPQAFELSARCSRGTRAGATLAFAAAFAREQGGAASGSAREQFECSWTRGLRAGTAGAALSFERTSRAGTMAREVQKGIRVSLRFTPPTPDH